MRADASSEARRPSIVSEISISTHRNRDIPRSSNLSVSQLKQKAKGEEKEETTPRLRRNVVASHIHRVCCECEGGAPKLEVFDIIPEEKAPRKKKKPKSANRYPNTKDGKYQTNKMRRQLTRHLRLVAAYPIFGKHESLKKVTGMGPARTGTRGAH